MGEESEEVEPSETEETSDDVGNWDRMGKLIDEAVGKHVGALDIEGKLKGVLKSWSPAVKPSKSSPPVEETPKAPPAPKRSDPPKKKGIWSEGFFSGLKTPPKNDDAE